MSRKFWIVIKSPKRKYHFTFFAWVSHNEKEWRMADEFYIKKFRRLPDGQHAEFIIYSEEIIKHPLAAANPSPLHIALSKDGKSYCICWPTTLSEFPLSTHILSAWCVGTVYTMENGIDFATILDEQHIAQGDFVAFVEYLKEKQGISIINMQSGD